MREPEVKILLKKLNEFCENNDQNDIKSGLIKALTYIMACKESRSMPYDDADDISVSFMVMNDLLDVVYNNNTMSDQ